MNSSDSSLVTQQTKLDILKTVNIFLETPPEALAEVANLLEEINILAGESVFEKGDMGSAMYIVVRGSVRVHDGEMTLNYLDERDVFGEMAALDPEPRSASVTAVEDTVLFRLEREPFRQLMARAPAVADGIIRILSARLRARMRNMKEDYQYMQQFGKVMNAAAAVESGVYRPEALDEVSKRTDELGQLARVFQRMVKQVYAREESLKAKIAALHIEIDEAKKAREVAEITESDYFQQLHKKARGLRKSKSADAEEGTKSES